MRNKVLVLTADSMGRGDEALGRTVLANFLKALAQQSEKPKALFLLNSAVHLAVRDSEAAAESLKTLEQGGCRILACLTCVRHFNLTERIEPHRLSSVATLVELMSRYETITF